MTASRCCGPTSSTCCPATSILLPASASSPTSENGTTASPARAAASETERPILPVALLTITAGLGAAAMTTRRLGAAARGRELLLRACRCCPIWRCACILLGAWTPLGRCRGCKIAFKLPLVSSRRSIGAGFALWKLGRLLESLLPLG